MNLFRKFLVFISVIIFFNSLLLLAIVWTTNNTVAKREVVKYWMAESGVYDNIVERIVQEVQKEIDKNTSQVGINADIDIAVLTDAADSTFTPDILQNAAETVLDGTYNWLEGTSPELDFVIDFSEQKAVLADKLAEEATTTLNALPECTTIADALQSQNSSPFDAYCKPPVGYEKQIANFRDDFVNSNEFFPNPIINADNIKIETGNGERTIGTALPEIPVWYKRAKNLVWALFILVLLSTLGLVFASKTRRNGVKKVAGALIFASVILATIGFLIQQSPDLLSVDNDTIQQTIAKPIVDQVAHSFSKYSYDFAIIYSLLAIIGTLVVFLTEPKQKLIEEPHQKTDDSNIKQSIPANEGSDNPKTNLKEAIDDTKTEIK